MHVVAAHMPDWHGVPFGIRRLRLACIGKPSVLCDGERIHIGAQHHCRSFAIAEQSNHARLAHARRHLVTGLSQPVGSNTCRPRLVHRQFGMGVNVFIKRFQLGEQFAEARQHHGCAVGGGRLSHDQSPFVIDGDCERLVSDCEALRTRSLSMAYASAVAITAPASNVKEFAYPASDAAPTAA